ncbi:hypothetical protein [Rahnella sp. PCH160]|uniref:hypothetical protein n=1 Tax=Rahnella sp. PCH160 TaxID=3447928 RepID=UPI0039FBDEC0
MMRNKNSYCKPEGNNFRRWDLIDYTISKWNENGDDSYWGQGYLFLYKDVYIKTHKETIIKHAREAKIPSWLLADVAWQEAGGKPDDLKPQVLLFRQLIDSFRKNNDYSNKVSIGIVAIQIRVVAEILGIAPEKITSRQQLQISRCLQTDDFNLKMVSLHLRDLIKYDYPDIDTEKLTDENIILVGARYNRGIQRTKGDFVRAISLPEGNADRDYISYGLAIIKRRARVKNLMDIHE